MGASHLEIAELVELNGKGQTELLKEVYTENMDLTRQAAKRRKTQHSDTHKDWTKRQLKASKGGNYRIICYLRLVMVLVAFYYIYTRPYLTASLYYFSQVPLDLLDGFAARSLNQCSKFGALFDIVLDRATMQGMLMALDDLYPRYSFWIKLYAFIRLFSICFYLVWRHVSPEATKKGFYNKTYFFGSLLFETIVWGGSELFPVLMYVLYFTDGPKVDLGSSFGEFRVLVVLAYITFASSSYIFSLVVLQFIQSCLYLLKLDETEKHSE